MNIGLSEINRRTVVKELATILADEFVLYTKTRNAHWNVIGNDFAEKHKLFESQYEQRSFSSYNSASIIAILLSDHETIIRNLRNQISVLQMNRKI